MTWLANASVRDGLTVLRERQAEAADAGVPFSQPCEFPSCAGIADYLGTSGAGQSAYGCRACKRVALVAPIRRAS